MYTWCVQREAQYQTFKDHLRELYGVVKIPYTPRTPLPDPGKGAPVPDSPSIDDFGRTTADGQSHVTELSFQRAMDKPTDDRVMDDDNDDGEKKLPPLEDHSDVEDLSGDNQKGVTPKVVETSDVVTKSNYETKGDTPEQKFDAVFLTETKDEVRNGQKSPDTDIMATAADNDACSGEDASNNVGITATADKDNTSDETKPNEQPSLDW